MGLLAKFENVQIQNETRVSEDDIFFCKHQEESYQAAVNTWGKAQSLFKEVMNTYGADNPSYFDSKPENRVYISQSDDISFSETRLEQLKSVFVNRICNYFSKKYNVSIPTYEIIKKYDTCISHQDIIDEIFEQLDGLDFKEKAIQELKDSVCKSLTNRWGGLELKNKKLVIPSIIYIDEFEKKWSNASKLSYSSKDNVRALFLGLSHFEYQMTNTHPKLNQVSGLWLDGKDEKVFTKHEVNLEKVTSVKPFKNGKVEVVFATREFAKEFAAEYLKYA